MKQETGYILETITILRPSLIGQKYLNHDNYEFLEMKGTSENIIVVKPKDEYNQTKSDELIQITEDNDERDFSSEDPSI